MTRDVIRSIAIVAVGSILFVIAVRLLGGI